MKEKRDVSKLKIPTLVYSRIVGYLQPVETWNEGKQQEWKERKTYKVENERANEDSRPEA